MRAVRTTERNTAGHVAVQDDSEVGSRDVCNQADCSCAAVWAEITCSISLDHVAPWDVRGCADALKQAQEASCKPPPQDIVASYRQSMTIAQRHVITFSPEGSCLACRQQEDPEPVS